MSTSINPNFFNPTGFKINIDNRYFRNMAFFAQAVEHPGVTGTAAEVPIARGNDIRVNAIPMPASNLTFSDLIVTFILDEDWKVYTEMYDWMVRQVGEKYTPAGFNSRGVPNTDIPTFADITVTTLTNHSNPNKKIQYVDCLPTFLGQITMESNQEEAPPVVFQTTFNYSYFKVT